MELLQRMFRIHDKYLRGYNVALQDYGSGVFKGRRVRKNLSFYSFMEFLFPPLGKPFMLNLKSSYLFNSTASNILNGRDWNYNVTREEKEDETPHSTSPPATN